MQVLVWQEINRIHSIAGVEAEAIGSTQHIQLNITISSLSRPVITIMQPVEVGCVGVAFYNNAWLAAQLNGIFIRSITTFHGPPAVDSIDRKGIRIRGVNASRGTDPDMVKRDTIRRKRYKLVPLVDGGKESEHLVTVSKSSYGICLSITCRC